MNELSLGIAFLSGISYFFSPCILPLVPSFLSFISGVSFQELKTDSQKARKKLIVNALFFMLGFSFLFISLGLGASVIGEYIFRLKLPIQKIGGVIIIGLGSYLLFQNKFRLFLSAKSFMPRIKPAGLLGTFFVGGVFALSFTACATPILVAILTMASVGATAARGGLLLGMFSLGIGVPFMVSAVSLSLFLTLFEKVRKHLRVFEIIAGVILISFGFYLVRSGF
ncbi:MAG: cytochrome c biogenesis CcdA family protein [Candidatus Saelkia tenebricola]|nr:cytochrome c biogenesis CcdA family protein [Candidatus Saelkia tenebricola]